MTGSYIKDKTTVGRIHKAAPAPTERQTGRQSHTVPGDPAHPTTCNKSDAAQDATPEMMQPNKTFRSNLMQRKATNGK